MYYNLVLKFDVDEVNITVFSLKSRAFGADTIIITIIIFDNFVAY